MHVRYMWWNYLKIKATRPKWMGLVASRRNERSLPEVFVFCCSLMCESARARSHLNSDYDKKTEMSMSFWSWKSKKETLYLPWLWLQILEIVKYPLLRYRSLENLHNYESQDDFPIEAACSKKWLGLASTPPLRHRSTYRPTLLQKAPTGWNIR